MHHASMDTLTERHARLDRDIASQARKPGTDDLDISRMKRERLSLKDQLEALRS